MGAWLKLFTDGTLEHGSDELIAKREASWTRGRLDGIEKVRLFNRRRTCSLIVPNTNWHQFDRFSVIVSEGTQQPTITHRVVQAEIQSHHVGLYLVCSDSGANYAWTVVRELRDADRNRFHKKLTDKHVSQWLTVILPDRDYPGITFSTKGKMNDNQHISK
jgi:hypothetical protein